MNLKRRSVVLMVVLTVVTFGLYYPFWFLRRRAALNRLDSPKKLQEDHLAGPEDRVSSPILLDRVNLSGLMTFFFQSFYLQYVINRHIAGSLSRTIAAQ